LYQRISTKAVGEHGIMSASVESSLLIFRGQLSHFLHDNRFPALR